MKTLDVKPCIISDGTLNHKHLMPKLFAFYMEHELPLGNLVYPSLMDTCTHMSEDLKEQIIKAYWESEDVAWDWNEMVDQINMRLPTGLEFSSHPGDGACFGIFLMEGYVSCMIHGYIEVPYRSPHEAVKNNLCPKCDPESYKLSKEEADAL